MSDWWIDATGTVHERCQLLVYVGNEFLGQAEIDPGECPDLGYRRGGTLYVCRHCGEVWARLVLLDHTGALTSFDRVSEISCSKHPDQWNLPGSLLEDRNAGYLRFLPPAALQREFNLYMRHYGYNPT